MKKTTIKNAKKRADKAFSLYIRYRDKGVCCTCGKTIGITLEEKVKSMQCGHFIRRNYLATRFDEINCNCQCAGCNIWGNGKEVEHGRYIENKHGEGTIEKLHQKARIITPMRAPDYLDIERIYKEKLKDLLK